MKKSWNFWRFPGSEWESATLNPNFLFFSFATSFFFSFPLIFMDFLDFRCHRQGKWKKMIKKWKFPRVFEDFLVQSENLQLWVQIFIFFICNFIFFHFPLFLMVFHCFSLIFMVLLDFRCHGQGKWKKNIIKKWKFPRFWKFPGSEWESATLSPNFHFFSFATSFFFIFLCFWWSSIFLRWFSWFSWISGATGKEYEKKWSSKWKKWCLKWKKMKFEGTKNEKKKSKKMKNKWKQKNDSKTKWKKWSYKWKPNEK